MPTKEEKKKLTRSHSANEIKKVALKVSTGSSRVYSISLLSLSGAAEKLKQAHKTILDSSEVLTRLRYSKVTEEQATPKWANGAMVLLPFTELDAELYRITFQPTHVLAPTELVPVIKEILQGRVNCADRELTGEDMPLGASASWYSERSIKAERVPLAVSLPSKMLELPGRQSR